MEITRIPAEGYEEVYRATDERTGLKAYVAVHDTTLERAAVRRCGLSACEAMLYRSSAAT